MKRHFSAFAFLASALLLTACSQEDWGEEGGKSPAKKNVVTFVIGGNSSSTRAGSDGQAAAAPRTLVAPTQVIDLPYEEGETPLCLVETVTDMDENYADAVLGTRGTPVFTENFDQLYGDNLYVTAYEPQTGGTVKFNDPWGSYLGENGTIKYTKVDDYTYAYDYTNDQDATLSWPEGDKGLWFFLEAPYDYSGDDAAKQGTKNTNREFWSDGSIRFAYTDPNTPANGVITNGAINQTDFLFSSKKVTAPQKNIENHILMYHCLTGVKFQMGNLNSDGSALDGLTKIKSVTLTNIYSKGSCVLTPNYGDSNTSKGSNPSNKNAGKDDASKSAQCAIWSSLNTPVSYTETYDWSDGKDPTTDYLSGGTKNLPDDFYSDTNGSTDVSKFNLNDPDASRTLYLVPQTTAEGAMIEIEYQVGETTHKARVPFNGMEWKAGQIHTYTLTVSGLDVQISATTTNGSSAVQVTNSGTETAYLRVAVAAAWFAGNDFVAPYTFTITGDEYQNRNTSSWIEGEDGFLYYKYPVPAASGVNAQPFTSFTPSTEPTFKGAHVEWKFIVQAVAYDRGEDHKASFQTAWGNVHLKNSPTDLVVNSIGTVVEE